MKDPILMVEPTPRPSVIPPWVHLCILSTWRQFLEPWLAHFFGNFSFWTISNLPDFSSFPFFLSFQKSTFNRVLLPFFFLANNFPNSMILKRFEIKHEFNFVIPINGTYEINSCKYRNGLWWGAQHMRFYDWWIVWLIRVPYMIYSALWCACDYPLIVH